jgi:hypothetical protein
MRGGSIRSHLFLAGSEVLGLCLEDCRHLLLLGHRTAQLSQGVGLCLDDRLRNLLPSRRVLCMYGHLAGDISSRASSAGNLGRHAPGNDRGGPRDDGGIVIVHCDTVSTRTSLRVRESTQHIPSFMPSSAQMTRSKSVPSPSPLRRMISRFSSKTEMPVPSNSTRVGSFWDLNLKKTEEAMSIDVE